ncbi:PREDICTED: NAC transcription factor 29-like [Fragaria vesca subsp. vesca]|uniref:NAC transcription factor 29-like n=1 Tax=Fragaria vesca subsp. vesca TaxID=101020 RepID=UPI0002C3173D|nr:PREDICTED: NAC transcription factor 29-like [Fragaria vesca subsp. vesca]
MAAPVMQIKGMRFHPTDVELIEYFLHDKADADQAGCYSSFIHECNDLYGEKAMEPWDIWDKYGGSTYEEGEPLYFYTKRIKLNSDGKRFNRKVGSGTWSGEYSKDVVVSSQNGITKIGTMRNLRYEMIKGCDATQNGAWLMHEYESAFDIEHDYVICALKRNPRRAQANQEDAEITKKNSVKKRKSASFVDHQSRKRKKKLKEEEIYEIIDLEPSNMVKEERKEETAYDDQGRSSCTQLPEQQPYHHDQDNVTDYFSGRLGNNYDDGICLDDLIGPINSPYYKSFQYENQLYHGDDSKFNFMDYTNGGTSQLPENQLYHRSDDSKFNVMDYMNIGGMSQLPDDQATVDYLENF